jgi:hypothetical protein
MTNVEGNPNVEMIKQVATQAGYSGFMIVSEFEVRD